MKRLLLGLAVAGLLLPAGALADRFGTSHSFLIYAAFMLPLCALLALVIRRLRRANEGGDAPAQ